MPAPTLDQRKKALGALLILYSIVAFLFNIGIFPQILNVGLLWNPVAILLSPTLTKMLAGHLPFPFNTLAGAVLSDFVNAIIMMLWSLVIFVFGLGLLL